MAWQRTSARQGPTRPPERELVKTSSGLSGSSIVTDSAQHPFANLMLSQATRTWEWPMAWQRTSARRGPARPPERELMNTSSGLSGSAEPRNSFVPRRYSCGILPCSRVGSQCRL